MGWLLQEQTTAGGNGTALEGAGSRTLRNTALVMVARVFAQVVTLATFMLMNRHLAPSGYGLFTFVVNTTALVTVIIDLGFNTLFQREAARWPKHISRYLSKLLSGRLLFALVALIVLSGILDAKKEASFIAPGFVMMVLASYQSLLRGTLYALQRLRYESIAIVFESVVLLGAVAVGAFTHQGPAFYLWAYALRYGLDCIYFVLVLTLGGFARIRLNLDVVFIINWAWRGFPFALTFIITGIYFNIDVPLLTFIKGLTETGYYSSGYKLFSALLFLPQAVLSVLFPVLSVSKSAHDQERLVWAVGRFFKILFMLGWPITVGTWLLAPSFHFLYYYPQSEPALRILAVGIVFMFVNNAFIGTLNAIDRQSSFTWAALWSMFVNVGLNLMVIPLFGYIGASWATVATEIALGTFGWILVARHLTRIPILRLCWRSLLAGCIMGAVIFPFQHVTTLELIPVIAGGAVVYGVALLLVRAFDREELAMARRALRLRS
jgi:O-antigen/teichoic acid export membrane protein